MNSSKTAERPQHRSGEPTFDVQSTTQPSRDSTPTSPISVVPSLPSSMDSNRRAERLQHRSGGLTLDVQSTAQPSRDSTPTTRVESVVDNPSPLSRATLPNRKHQHPQSPHFALAETKAKQTNNRCRELTLTNYHARLVTRSESIWTMEKNPARHNFGPRTSRAWGLGSTAACHWIECRC
jgi:hypothetical protein